MVGTADNTVAEIADTPMQLSREGAVPLGCRLPGIVADERGGGTFDYHRDVVRGPTVFLAAPHPSVLREVLARPLTVVVPGYEEAPSAEGAIPADGARLARLHMLGRRIPSLDRALFGDPPATAAALLADPNQRVVSRWDGTGSVGAWLDGALARLARPVARERRDGAPVLMLPEVFEPDLRTALMRRLDAEMHEGLVSIRVGGETRNVPMPDKKRRRDHTLDRADPLYAAAADRIGRRVMPDLHKAFWIEKLRPEAFYLARYDDDRADFFAAHRDNNTPGTARRRIAVSVELNDDYEGGGLIFSEYADHLHRAPAGGALAFSCSLMHEAVPVTLGSRYVLLAFLAEP